MSTLSGISQFPSGPCVVNALPLPKVEAGGFAVPKSGSRVSTKGRGPKKNRFFLGKSPKLWMGGGQES